MPTAAEDQTDILAANERLTADLTNAVRERDASRTQLSSITAERDQLRTENARLIGEAQRHAAAATDAQARLTALTADHDRLASVDHDFNRRLAADLAKHGIRTSAIPTGATSSSSTDLVAQYQSITDPKAKAEFITRHEKELRSAIG